MKKIGLLLLTMGLLVGCSPKTTHKFTIGILLWTDHPALNDAQTGFITGLEELGLTDQIRLIEKNAFGESTNADIIVSQLVADQVDLIYAIATPAAQAAANGTKDTNIPILFNAVTDAVTAGLVKSNEKPGGLITGVSDMAPIGRQLQLIRDFLPTAKTIGVLYNTGEDNSLVQIAEIEKLIAGFNLKLKKQGLSSANEIALASEQMNHEVDAFYIITDNMIAKAAAQVVSIAIKEKRPVFMAEAGQFEVGILASDSISYNLLGKQAANMAEKILIQQIAPADIPVEISTSTELFVSKQVAELLGLEIPAIIAKRAIWK